MNSEESSPVPQPVSRVASHCISLSPYVNEPLPNWEELLSTHDVARLTRRPRWVLASLALLGQFPRKQCFHGRNIGWLRSDVLRWLARNSRVLRCRSFPAINARSLNTQQGLFPLGFARRSFTARRRAEHCLELRNPSRRVRVRRSHAESREG